MLCLQSAKTVEVPPELAQELLEASDQYLLDSLKRLCEATIAAQLAPDNVAEAFDLAEAFNAPELAKRCALFCLENYEPMVAAPKGGGVEGYTAVMEKMADRMQTAIEAQILARKMEAAEEDGMSPL